MVSQCEGKENQIPKNREGTGVCCQGNQCGHWS